MLRSLLKRLGPEPVELPEVLARVKAGRQRHRHLSPHDAATDLVHWLASEGLDGWLTSAEIDAAWEARRAMRDAPWMSSALIRETLRGLPGVRYIERTRIAGPEFAEVRARFRAMKKRHERAALYWIPPPDEEPLPPGQ